MIGQEAIMNKSSLFSIGEFSQMTGASIKALHYYEKIGILKPAWVDERNGYRYYEIRQYRSVEVIELLLDLGIRLNQLPEFASDNFTHINYRKILQQGKSLMLDRIQELENKMRYIDYLDENLNAEPFPAKNSACIPIWLMPYDKSYSDLPIANVLKLILQDIRPYGLQFRHSYGRIMFCNGKQQRTYFFVDLKIPSQKRIIHENIFYLPAGKYRSIEQNGYRLEDSKKIFSDLFSMPYDKIIIETETAIHCLLPDAF